MRLVSSLEGTDTMKVKTARGFARNLSSAAEWFRLAQAEDLKDASALDEAEIVFRALKQEITLNTDT